MSLLTIIIVTTILLLGISFLLLWPEPDDLWILIFVVCVLLGVPFLVILTMGGPSKSQDAAPMVRETPVVFFMALPGELLRPLAIRNLSLTPYHQRAEHRSEVLVTSALARLVAVTGTSNPGRELIVHTHKGN